MKVRNMLAAAAVAAFTSSAAVAQNAEFAAVYDMDEVMIASVHTDGQGNYGAEMDLATIHLASQKEMLITVSGVVNLVTMTEAKGRNKAGQSTAIAEGGVGLHVAVAPTGTDRAEACAMEAYRVIPGYITLASRTQQLTVDVDLDVVGELEDCDEQCIADSLGIDGSVTVALGLDTTAAHSFQFLGVDYTAGDYDVIACFDLSSAAYVLEGEGSANAMVALGHRILTVQEVRAVKNSIGTDLEL